MNTVNVSVVSTVFQLMPILQKGHTSYSHLHCFSKVFDIALSTKKRVSPGRSPQTQECRMYTVSICLRAANDNNNRTSLNKGGGDGPSGPMALYNDA